MTIVEIEPLVPQAAPTYFSEPNFDVVSNPKVQVRIDDGRHYLADDEGKVRRDHGRSAGSVGEGRGEPVHQGILRGGQSSTSIPAASSRCTSSSSRPI